MKHDLKITQALKSSKGQDARASMSQGNAEGDGVLRDQDLNWLVRVAKKEQGLLILADEKGAPVESETLRRCLALGVIEPFATEEGIGFRRTERALALLAEAPADAKRDLAALRSCLDTPDSPLRLASKGGMGTTLKRRLAPFGACLVLAGAAGFAAVVAIKF